MIPMELRVMAGAAGYPMNDKMKKRSRALSQKGIEIEQDFSGAWIAVRGNVRIAGPNSRPLRTIVMAERARCAEVAAL